MSEIRPCPFCGVVPTISGDPDSEEYVRGYCLGFVGCFNEQCPMPQDVVIEPTQKEATAKWNTRPIEDALTARIAELEAESERLSQLLHDEMSQLEIATDLGNKRWTALNEIYEDGEKHNTHWCKRIAQEGLGLK